MCLPTPLEGRGRHTTLVRLKRQPIYERTAESAATARLVAAVTNAALCPMNRFCPARYFTVATAPAFAVLVGRRIELYSGNGALEGASVSVPGTPGSGAPALTADNMFRTWRIDAKKMLHVGRNTIEVDLQSPITKLQPSVLAMKHPLPGSYDSAFGSSPKGKQTANYVRKANYQYGWDWAPRLVTLGIWRPVRLEAYDGVRLDDAHVAQTHLDDQVAVLEAQAEIWSDRPRTLDVEVAITDPDGACRGADKGTPETPAVPPASPLTRGRGQVLAQALAEQDQQQHQPKRGGPPTRQSTRIASQAGRRWAKPTP